MISHFCWKKIKSPGGIVFPVKFLCVWGGDGGEVKIIAHVRAFINFEKIILDTLMTLSSGHIDQLL